MDQDLSELERRASANPGDRELADALDRRLLRAGREEQVLERYRLKFRCSKRFEDLPYSDDPARRSCDRCQRSVHFVRTPEELSERAAAGECVAIPRASLAAACLELAQSPRLTSAQEAQRPCVQETTLRYVDLDQVEVSSDAIELIPPIFAHTYQVVPVALDDRISLEERGSAQGPRSLDERRPRLEVAVAAASGGVVLDDLRFMLNLEIELVLADSAAVLRALERYYPNPGGSPFEDGYFLGEVAVG